MSTMPTNTQRQNRLFAKKMNGVAIWTTFCQTRCNSATPPITAAVRIRHRGKGLTVNRFLLVVLFVLTEFSFCSCWNVLNTPTSRRQFLTSILVSSGITFSSLETQARNLPESGSIDRSKVGTVEALIPIVALQRSLQNVESKLKNTQGEVYIASTLREVPKDERAFKALFDAYSDPVSYKQRFVDQNAFLVYYTKGFDGPGRASIEQDLPTRQPRQYGARNDAWIAWDNFLAEYNFHLQNQASYGSKDLLDPLSEVIHALDRYLTQVPASQLEQASNALPTPTDSLFLP
jgi:hypothetical protein